MRIVSFVTSLVALLATSSLAIVQEDPLPLHRMQIIRRVSSSSWSKTHKLLPRQSQYNNIAQETNPVTAAALIQTMDGVPGKNFPPDTNQQIIKDDGNTANPPWLQNVTFEPTPDTTQTAYGQDNSGWNALPNLNGFALNRTWEVIPGMVMPFYVTNNYRPGGDNSAIKRVIISMPGKPRDSWKYGNLFRNALNVAVSNGTWGVKSEEVMIVSPAFFNQFDKQAGAVREKELYWHGSQWQSGGYSQNNKDPRQNLTNGYSSYSVLDNVTDWLFSSEFPNLNQVVVAGHSMGAQAVMRYSLLKKTKPYDPNIHFWIANPGSWVWLDDQHPYPNSTCQGGDSWPYGIGNVSSIRRYARKDVQADKLAVLNRFRSRKLHYALGLLDTGAGDTHCQALLQGGSHLDRGSQFILALNRTTSPNQVFPITHSLDIIAGTSHQDYPMIRSDPSLQRLFVQDYNIRYPFLTDFSNPSDNDESSKKPKKSPQGKKSFDTPEYRVAAFSLLGASLGFIFISFSILPILFSPNLDQFDQSFKWETESRRRLLDH